MNGWIHLVGPDRTVEIWGITLVGVNAKTGVKLLATLALIALVLVLGRLLQALAGLALRRRREHVTFWARQGIRLFTATLLLVGLVSIWFSDPARLATAIGLVTAGVAFAMQKVVTAVAGYFVIFRGNTFNIGDRIRMGGVRGDVIGLDFMKTTIMEMGQPPPVQADEPAMWVRSRQYTGRIVTVSNSKVFDEPVYNYSRDFPYLWEEMQLPIPYGSDRARAEQILLDAADRHTIPIGTLGAKDVTELCRRYSIKTTDVRPRVYIRLTDNWVELTVRFLAQDHGIRELKDALSRDILADLEKAKIRVASQTLEVMNHAQ